MFVKASREEEAFRPVALSLVFNTLEELTAFYIIFNYSPIVEAADIVGFSFASSAQIRKEIDSMFLDGISYQETFSTFEKQMKG